MSIITNDEEGIKKAGKLLREGRLVAFPTETVYGLGANGLNEEAVKNIFITKGRPQDNPLILHIADKSWLTDIAEEIPEYVNELMDAFWPGPMSIILKAKTEIPRTTTAGLDTVAIRFPNHKIAQAIIAEAGVPIAAPSANLSGRPSPTNFRDCYNDLKDKDVYVFEGGETDIGIESTVILCTSYPPQILRPGKIDADAIKRVVGDVIVGAVDKTVVRSPGQKYGHYMAKKPTLLLDMKPEDADQLLEKIKPNAIFISAEENKYQAKENIVIGSYFDPDQAAKHYFKSLRDADMMDGDMIVIQGFSKEGIGEALFNRMKKSASGKVMEDKDEDWIC